jgi:hypothetical protein
MGDMEFPIGNIAHTSTAEGSFGRIGGGVDRPTGQLDVAIIQSLVRKGVVDDPPGTRPTGRVPHVLIAERQVPGGMRRHEVEHPPGQVVVVDPCLRGEVIARTVPDARSSTNSWCCARGWGDIPWLMAAEAIDAGSERRYFGGAPAMVASARSSSA